MIFSNAKCREIQESRCRMKKSPKPDRKTLHYLILTLALAAVATAYWVTQIKKPSVEPAVSSVVQQAANTQSERPAPPFYVSAQAAKPFPKLIPAEYYRRYPLVERAYKDAAEIPGVLAQQPCYCHCDSVGHHSLLDCYSSDHAAG